jgi:regulator of cell morphogenesis and NO signaling
MTLAVPDAAPSAADPADLPTGALIDHILKTFHEVHRAELIELVAMARKVEAVHAGQADAPRGLADFLRQVQGELEAHMKKEELILFPAMRRMAEGGGLEAPIAQMRLDHEDHGAQLAELERRTGGFTSPEGACRTWRALYDGARKLSDELKAHIALENGVLFPRFEAS